jgi:hypothetical protein
MKEVTSANSIANKQQEDLDIIVELVWLDLQGDFSRDIVRQTVSSLFEEYDEVTVRNYLPIIIQRRAKAILLQESSIEENSNE